MPFFDPIRIGASGAADDFTVDRSLRFNDNDSAYLTRTPSGAGNRKTFTLSVWIKRGNFGTDQAIIDAQNSSGNQATIRFSSEGGSDNKINIFYYDGSSFVYRVHTNAELRDPSAWYHLVIAFDTTQATASNRIKIYQNGVQLTDMGSSSYPSQNYDTPFNNTILHTIGRNGTASNYFDGYMAEINFIDGSQLTPSSFGETDSTTGQWNPIDTSSLTFGTNGFRLQFADNSGTTATTLGKDTSGNSNNFTPNNFSVSAGIGNDSLEDTPTNNFPTLNPLDVLSGGNTRSLTISEGNLKVAVGSGGEGNVNMTTVATIEIPTSGKWYWEVHVTDVATAAASRTHFGIINQAAKFDDGLDFVYADVAGAYAYAADGSKAASPSGNFASYGASYTDNDIIGVAVDADNGSIAFYKNGASQGTAYTGLDMSEGFMPVVGYWGTFNINFGQRAFDYTVPTGYKNLSSANLPDPTILLPNNHFDTLLYTGNGSGQTLSGLNFSPDWLWIKSRSSAEPHELNDQVRGTLKSLSTNNSNTENTASGRVEAFTSDGFTLGNSGNVNSNSETFVAWNWNAGDTDGKTYTVTVVDDSGNKFRFDGYGTSAVTLDLAEGGTYIFNYPSGHPFRFSTTADGTHGGGSEYTTGVTHNSSTQVTIVVAASTPTLYYYCSSHSGMGGQVNTNAELGSSNFAGTIQSITKANATAGFSILTYSGNGTDGATVGHGLGVAPDCIITKSRNLGTIGTAGAHWTVAHKGLTNGMNGGSSAYKIHLSLTQAEGTNNHGCVSAVSSTTFTLKDGSSGTAPRAHVNESSGNYVAYVFSEVAGFSKFGKYTGNQNADGAFVFTGFRPALVITKGTWGGNWNMYDNSRNSFNVANKTLYPNLSNAESTESSSGNQMDLLSNGFKLRGSDNDTNHAADFIYLAFAESPFKNARAR